MNNTSIRVLKHDILSDVGSIFSALKLIASNKDNPPETQEILSLICDKEDGLKKNLESIWAVLSEVHE